MTSKADRIWKAPESADLPEALRQAAFGSPVLAQALWRRGIHTAAAARAFLDPAAYAPRPPTDLPGLADTAERLERAIQRQESIVVWGDFDVDGQTATSVLVSTLRDLGAMVDYHIPVRGPESHGVNLPKLKQILADNPQVILTCDTGIAAHAAAELARAHGVDFLVTDHHELPPELPAATHIVNPRLLPPKHALSTLPGVGVAYKLAEELYRRAGFSERAYDLLDLVALGIVADVATLYGDTRYLLQRGLAVLRRAQRPAIQAMLDFTGLDPSQLTEEHIGFLLGPRLNAIGRLGDANPVVEFFLSDDLPRVRVLAQQLEGLNAERKLQTRGVFQAAMAALEQNPALHKGPAIVLARPSWPAGIIGIVASRLVEVFGKPVILLSIPEDGPARGSARSIPGVNITTAITAVYERQTGLLNTFGGHAMAAGLSLPADHIEDFRRALWMAIQEQVGAGLPAEALQIDAVLPLQQATLAFADTVARLAPFGAGFPALVFVAQDLQLKREATLGRDGQHRLMTVADPAGETHKVIWWNGAGQPAPQGRFNLAYRLKASTFNGAREVQIEWIDFQAAAEPVTVKPANATRQFIDRRKLEQPLVELRQLLAQDETLVWSEGEARSALAARQIEGCYRHELSPCQRLVIWSLPPGPQELRQALRRTAPETVYLFGIGPDATDAEQFLRRLSGLVKFAIKRQSGRAHLAALAAASAQRSFTVRRGLDWLQAKGLIQWKEPETGSLLIEGGTGQAGGDAGDILHDLELLLEETNAFRSYWAQAPIDDLQVMMAPDVKARW